MQHEIFIFISQQIEVYLLFIYQERRNHDSLLLVRHSAKKVSQRFSFLKVVFKIMSTFLALKFYPNSFYSTSNILLFFLEPDWYTPGKCYQYQKSSTTQTWQESSELSQAVGVGLGYAGVRDLNIRRRIQFLNL